MGCCLASWKHKRLRHIISRLQVDTVSLAETQINLILVLRIFSPRDKLFRGEELMSILINNKQEHLSMRQQGRVFTGVIGLVASMVMSTGSPNRPWKMELGVTKK